MHDPDELPGAATLLPLGLKERHQFVSFSLYTLGVNEQRKHNPGPWGTKPRTHSAPGLGVKDAADQPRAAARYCAHRPPCCA
jgi:hypothetical protein